MANRCPDCNKFVSTEVTGVEVDGEEVEDIDGRKGLFRCTITLSKTCADCGTELATKEIEIETEVDLTGFESVI